MPELAAMPALVERARTRRAVLVVWPGLAGQARAEWAEMVPVEQQPAEWAEEHALEILHVYVRSKPRSLDTRSMMVYAQSTRLISISSTPAHGRRMPQPLTRLACRTWRSMH
jgi:hypothetical protein